jgi:FKBP-type peptidyl-prolyl cis-trans isomerase
MAVRKDRFFALFGALLFAGSACALTIAVIISGVSNHNKTTAASSTASTSSTTEATKLEGTQLKDFTPVASIPTLQEIDTVPGTGTEVTSPTQTVTVDYTGAVAATGIIFQSSLDSGQTVSFPLNQVITGWTKGLIGMKVGGTRRLLIPAAEAYGASPPSGAGIPANADLVFDITLHSVTGS